MQRLSQPQRSPFVLPHVHPELQPVAQTAFRSSRADVINGVAQTPSEQTTGISRQGAIETTSHGLQGSRRADLQLGHGLSFVSASVDLSIVFAIELLMLIGCAFVCRLDAGANSDVRVGAG